MSEIDVDRKLERKRGFDLQAKQSKELLIEKERNKIDQEPPPFSSFSPKRQSDKHLSFSLSLFFGFTTPQSAFDKRHRLIHTTHSLQLALSSTFQQTKSQLATTRIFSNTLEKNCSNCIFELGDNHLYNSKNKNKIK